MNNDSNEKDLLSDFYEKFILSLANSADEAGVAVLKLDVNHASDSYFIDRVEDSDYLHSIDASNMEAELTKLWANDPIPGMSEIASPLMMLADHLHEDEEVSGEVSPFVYAMF